MIEYASIMSKSQKNASTQPRFNIEKLDLASPLTEDYLSRLLHGKCGVTLLVRSADGEKRRGGYFFCIVPKEDGKFTLETMAQEQVDYDFTLNELTRFVNHASGLRFDDAMLRLCQNHINFRTDEEP